jgi:hypothetical protein
VFRPARRAEKAAGQTLGRLAFRLARQKRPDLTDAIRRREEIREHVRVPAEPGALALLFNPAQERQAARARRIQRRADQRGVGQIRADLSVELCRAALLAHSRRAENVEKIADLRGAVHVLVSRLRTARPIDRGQHRVGVCLLLARAGCFLCEACAAILVLAADAVVVQVGSERDVAKRTRRGELDWRFDRIPRRKRNYWTLKVSRLQRIHDPLCADEMRSFRKTTLQRGPKRCCEERKSQELTESRAFRRVFLRST